MLGVLLETCHFSVGGTVFGPEPALLSSSQVPISAKGIFANLSATGKTTPQAVSLSSLACRPALRSRDKLVPAIIKS
jgi:hypothetical protein